MAIVAILAVAGFFVGIVLIDFHVSDVVLRWTVVAAIVDATMTILIPVFHLLSRKQFSAGTADAPLSPNNVNAEIARIAAQLAELQALPIHARTPNRSQPPMTAPGAYPTGRYQFTLGRMFLYLHIVAVVCCAARLSESATF